MKLECLEMILLQLIGFILWGVQGDSTVSSELYTPNDMPREEWLRCRGMPCAEWERRQRKLMLLESMYPGKTASVPYEASDHIGIQSAQLDGCIWYTEQQIDDMIKEMNSTLHKQHSRKKRKFDFFAYQTQWTLPIRYKFDGAHSRREMIIIRDAIKHWENHTCVRFLELGIQEHYNSQHVIFTKENTGCHSWVGKMFSHPQQVNLQAACMRYGIGIPVHEIGHAIGLWHEHQRTDRDFHVEIKFENMGAYFSQFAKKYTEALGVPYDMGSIMHYSSLDGTINGKPVIEAKDPLYQRSMGQRTRLSFNDAKIVNRVYCDRTCTQPLAKACQYQGYQDPNDCSRCRCAPGFAGQYCEDVAPAINANCGGLVNIHNSNDPVYVESPGYNIGHYDDNTECNWHIKVPFGYKIKLSFEGEFGIFCKRSSDCFHWLEIKYKGNLGDDGPRFCCEKTPRTQLVSDQSSMVLAFRSNFMSYSSLDRRGFRVKLQALNPTGSGDPSMTSTPTTTRSTSTTANPTTTKPTTTTTKPTTSTTTATKPTTTTKTTTTTTKPNTTTKPTTTTTKPTTSTTTATKPTTTTKTTTTTTKPNTTTKTTTTTTEATSTTTKSTSTTTAKPTPTTTKSTTTTTKPTTTRTTGPVIYDEECVNVDLSFLLDSSGSVGKLNWERQLNFTIKIIEQLQMSENCAKVGIITFGNSAIINVQFNNKDSKEVLINYIRKLEFKDEWTNTAAGLSLLLNKLYKEVNGQRSSVSNVTVVITDGEANTGGDPIEVAKFVHSSAIDIFGIGVGKYVNRQQLQGIAGSVDNVEYVDNYAELLTEDFLTNTILMIKESVSTDHKNDGTTTTTPTPSISYQYACTFETSSQAGTLCDLTQSKADDFDWYLNKGHTPSEPTGPSAAQSGRFYVYIEATGRENGAKARLLLPQVPSTTTYCLSFHYNMFGHHIYQLNVYIQDSSKHDRLKAWGREGEQGKDWLYSGTVMVSMNFGERIVFEGVRGAEYSGDIALDSINLTSC